MSTLRDRLLAEARERDGNPGAPGTGGASSPSITVKDGATPFAPAYSAPEPTPLPEIAPVQTPAQNDNPNGYVSMADLNRGAKTDNNVNVASNPNVYAGTGSADYLNAITSAANAAKAEAPKLPEAGKGTVAPGTPGGGGRGVAPALSEDEQAAKLGMSVGEYRVYQQERSALEKKDSQAVTALKPVTSALDSLKGVQDEINYLAQPNYGAGNIDLSKTPRFDNGDGTYSTVDSMSFYDEQTGLEILIPTVVQIDGQWYHVDEETAIEQFRKTGQYLGAFRTPEDATAYANALHQQQEELFSRRAELSAQFKAGQQLYEQLYGDYKTTYEDPLATEYEAFNKKYNPTAYYHDKGLTYDEVMSVIQGLDELMQTVPAGSSEYNEAKRTRDALFADRMQFASDEELDQFWNDKTELRGGAQSAAEIRVAMQDRFTLLGGDVSNDEEYKRLEQELAQAEGQYGDAYTLRGAAGLEKARRDSLEVLGQLEGSESRAAKLLDALAVYIATGIVPDDVMVSEFGLNGRELINPADQIGEMAKSALRQEGVDEQKAANTVETLLREGNARSAEALAKSLTEDATKNVLSGAAMTLLSVGTNLLSGFGMAEGLRTAMSGSTFQSADPNGSAMMWTNMTNAIRSGITEAVDWKVGKVDVFDEAYGIAASTLDSLAGMATGGGSVVLGSSAAAHTLQEEAVKGTPIGEALLTATAAGVFEGLFERWSIENFQALKNSIVAVSYRDVAKNIGKSFLTNMSEEFNTELANVIFDYLRQTPSSNFNRDIAQLMTEINPDTGKPYTQKEAQNKVWSDRAVQCIHAGITGGLQGILMGGTAQLAAISNVHELNKIYRIDREDAGIISNLVLARQFKQGSETRSWADEYLPRLNSIIEASKNGGNKAELKNDLVALLDELKASSNSAISTMTRERDRFGPTGFTEAMSQATVRAVQDNNHQMLHVETPTENSIREAQERAGMSQDTAKATRSLIFDVASGKSNLRFNGVDDQTLTSMPFRAVVEQVTGSRVFGRTAADVKRSLRDIAEMIGNRSVEVGQSAVEETAQTDLVPPTGGTQLGDVMNRVMGYDRSEWYDAPPASAQETTEAQPVEAVPAPEAPAGALAQETAPAPEAPQRVVPQDAKVNIGTEELDEAEFIKAATQSGEFTPEQAREYFQALAAGETVPVADEAKIRYAVAQAVREEDRAADEKAKTDAKAQGISEAQYLTQEALNILLHDKGLRVEFKPKSEMGQRNGEVDLDNGVIYINADAPEVDTSRMSGVAWIIGHEITHSTDEAIREAGGVLLTDRLLGYEKDGEFVPGVLQTLADSGAIEGAYAEMARDPAKLAQALKDIKKEYADFYVSQGLTEAEIDEKLTDDFVRGELAGDFFGTLLGINRFDEQQAKKVGTKFKRTDLLSWLAGIDNTPLKAAELTLRQRLEAQRGAKLRGKAFRQAYETTRGQMQTLMNDVSSALANPRESGAGTRESVGGAKALKADIDALNRAMKMAANGKDADEIFKYTGWWQDPADGKWRFEINDKPAKFVKNAEAGLLNSDVTGPAYKALRDEYRSLRKEYNAGKLEGEALKHYQEVKAQYLSAREGHRTEFWRNGGTIGDVIDHKLLFENYPGLKDVPFAFKDLGENTGGQYIPSDNKIELNSRLLGDTPKAQQFRDSFKRDLAPGVDATESNIVLSILLHEMQHQIQHTEDFATGGSVNYLIKPAREAAQRGYDYYQREVQRLERAFNLPIFDTFNVFKQGNGADVVNPNTGEVVDVVLPASTSLEDRIKAMDDWLDAQVALYGYNIYSLDATKDHLKNYAQADADLTYMTTLGGRKTYVDFPLYEALRGEQESNEVMRRQRMDAKERRADRFKLPDAYKLTDEMKAIMGRYNRQGVRVATRQSLAQSSEAEPASTESAPPTREEQVLNIMRRMQAARAQAPAGAPAGPQGRDPGLGAANAGFTGPTRDFEDWYKSAKSFLPISETQKTNTQGNRANRDAIQYPKSVDKSGGVMNRSAQTIRNAPITTDSLAAAIDQASANGAFKHLPYSDAKAMKRARGDIERNGWDQEYAKYKDAVDKGVTSKDVTTMGIALYNNAVTAGDNYAALDIAALMIRNASNTASALQAMQMLNKLGPDGQLYMAVRGVENIADELRKLYPDKELDMDAIKPLLEDYRNALIKGEQAAIKAAQSDIYKAIAEQLPSDWREKWRNWRYMSMLFNPQTHIRNILGNAGFFAPRLMKQANKAALERVSMGKIGEGSNRTTALLNIFSKADRARFKAGLDDYINVMDIIQSGGKQMGPRDEIEKLRTIFDKNWQKGLEAGRRLNSNLLDVEDTWFSKPAYAEALASYLKAQGIDGDDFASGNISDEMKAKAQAHAVKEAQKATYRDHNDFSDMISNIAKKGRAADAKGWEKAKSMAVEAALPFKRTPANIAARAWEYSPGELVTVVFSDIKKVHQAQAETRALEKQNDGSEEKIRAVNAAKTAEAEAVSDMLDHIASASTGTAIMAIGAMLARLGVVHGGKDDDKDQANFDKTKGIQEYSIDIGGRNYTIDWLAPEVLPLLTGVELYNTLSDMDGEKDIISELGDILFSLGEPMLNMTMLSSISDLISDVKYLDEGKELAGIAKNLATNYVSQYFPTVFGKLETIAEPLFDPEKRYREQNFVDKNSVIGKDEQNFISNIANKVPIPGVEYNQITYYDAWGRKQDNGNLVERVMRNLVVPWKVREEASTPYDDELQRLADGGATGVLPGRASWSTKVDGQYLTANEYELYTKTQGEAQYTLIGDLLGSKTYATLTDDEKAKAIKNVYSLAKTEAENAIRAERGEATEKTTAEKKGLDPSTYVLVKSVFDNATTPSGYKTTDTGDTPKWAKVLALLDDRSISNADKLKFINSDLSNPFSTVAEAREHYEAEKEEAKK